MEVNFKCQFMNQNTDFEMSVLVNIAWKNAEIVSVLGLLILWKCCRMQ